MNTWSERRRSEELAPDQLRRWQLDRLNLLLSTILPHNNFYARKLAGVPLPLASLDELEQLPHTYKDELLGEASQTDLAANRTFPLDRYCRFHRTSGTHGHPLNVLDTADDWQWWLNGWQYVLDAAEANPPDRAFLAFSFGPFIGFWSAFDAAVQRGLLTIPGGGMNTLARLEMIRSNRATLVFCTPSYALHMAETAAEHGIDLRSLAVRALIVAGEPGGSNPLLRQRIEEQWQARVIDHAGATEIGPWGYADEARRGLHVNESLFLPEFIPVERPAPPAAGELAELVLTTLGRAGCPVIRYRTGDLVRPVWNQAGRNRFVLLDGGVLGRVDDMVTVRGVNVFPGAIEQVLHGFPEIVEYRITIDRQHELDRLRIEVEDRLSEPDRIARELLVRIGLRVEVACVSPGSLPRFEGKGRRFLDRRKETA